MLIAKHMTLHVNKDNTLGRSKRHRKYPDKCALENVAFVYTFVRVKSAPVNCNKLWIISRNNDIAAINSFPYII